MLNFLIRTLPSSQENGQKKLGTSVRRQVDNIVRMDRKLNLSHRNKPNLKPYDRSLKERNIRNHQQHKKEFIQWTKISKVDSGVRRISRTGTQRPAESIEMKSCLFNSTCRVSCTTTMPKCLTNIYILQN